MHLVEEIKRKGGLLSFQTITIPYGHVCMYNLLSKKRAGMERESLYKAMHLSLLKLKVT